jgi:uncharacterized membrane protein
MMSEPGKGDEYDLQPPTPPANVPPPPTPGLKPGDPGWVPPTPIVEMADPEPEPEEVVDPDVQHHKAVAILGYIFFLLPLLLAPNSKYARFHANQGLMVFILWCVAVVGTIALTLGWEVLGHFLEKFTVLVFFFGCLVHIIPVVLLVGVFVLTIMGIIHAANGEKKGLPLIGHLAIIK